MRTSKFEHSIKNFIKFEGDFSSLKKYIDKNVTERIDSCPKKRKYAILIPFISTGAVLIHIAAILSIISMAPKIRSVQQHEPASNTTPQSGDLIKPYKKYQWFTFNNRKYKCVDLDYDCVLQQLIREEIGEMEITSTHFNRTADKTNIIINSIDKIDVNYGIAVNFEGNSGYYLYLVDSLEPNICLGDFITKTGLLEYGIIQSSSYIYSDGDDTKTIVTNKADTVVEELFANNYDKTNIYSADPFSPYNTFDTDIKVEIKMPSLGEFATYLYLNLDGCSRFSLIGSNTYLIDVEDVEKLKNFIIENETK